MFEKLNFARAVLLGGLFELSPPQDAHSWGGQTSGKRKS